MAHFNFPSHNGGIYDVSDQKFATLQPSQALPFLDLFKKNHPIFFLAVNA